MELSAWVYRLYTHSSQVWSTLGYLILWFPYFPSFTDVFSYYNVFISVCLCSYAEVRAEQRRELGIEESNPEPNADKVSLPF